MKRNILRALRSWKVWGLFLLLQFPSLRPLLKYVPRRFLWVLPLVWILALAYYAILPRAVAARGRIAQALAGPWVSVLIVAVILVANSFVYPIADARKQVRLGSDQDDAVILSSQNLIHGLPPYAVRTYFGNEISSGPGILVYALPFADFSRYFLFTPLYLLLFAFLLSRLGGSFLPSSYFLLLLISSPSFWELLFSGSDMLVVGMMFFVTTCSVFLLAGDRGPGAGSCLLAVLLGVLTLTTRVVFIYFVGVYFVFLLGRSLVRSAAYALALGAGVLSVHVGFYLWGEGIYAPLHVIGKGGELLSGPVKYAALVLCAWVGYLTFKRVRVDLLSWTFFTWLCLAVPLTIVGVMDLSAKAGDLRRWEGANYIALTIPVCLGSLALHASRKRSE